MTRKFAWWGISFLIGLILFNADMGKSIVAFSIAVVCSGTAVFVLLKKYRCYAVSVTLCILLGLAVGQTYTWLKYDRVVQYAGKTVKFEGVITDYSYTESGSMMIKVSGRINGGVKTKITFFADKGDYDYYDRVTVIGRVKAIEDSISFQSAEYNFPKGIFLQGASTPEITDSGKCGNYFLRSVCRMRDYTSDCLSAVLTDTQSGFLKAILCGDKTDIDTATKTKLYRCGVGHLFAMSGMHLSVCAVFLQWLLAIFRVPRKIKSPIIQLEIIFLMAIAGFSPSVVRAGIMLIAVFFADIFERETDCLNSLGICVAVMGLINPYVIGDTAFILSFSSAFAVGAVYPKLYAILGEKVKKTKLRSLINSLLMTLTVLFVTMPFSAWLFSEVSVIAPLTNLIMVPICTVALMLSLAGMLFGGASAVSVVLFRLSGLLVNLALKLADFFAKLKFASVPSRYMKVLLLCAVSGCVAVAVAVKLEKLRIFTISAVCLYAGLYSAVSFMRFADKSVHIIILPDSKGCAVVVYSENYGVVADICSYGGLYRSVQNAMSARGIYTFEALFSAENGEETAEVYESRIYPAPEKSYSDESDVNYFVSGDEAVFGDFSVSANDDGYTVTAYSKSFEISKFCFTENGNVYDFSEEEYPLEIVISKDKYEVGRLNYAFGEQH